MMYCLHFKGAKAAGGYFGRDLPEASFAVGAAGEKCGTVCILGVPRQRAGILDGAPRG